MKILTLLDFLKKPKFEMYFYISGYYVDGQFFISKESMDDSSISLEKKSCAILHRENLFKKLMKKNQVQEGKLLCLVKFRRYSQIYIVSTLKINLLDESNNIVDSIKVGESEMPVNLRGKI